MRRDGLPDGFGSIRDLFVIHTDQMLKHLDRKPPIYGVALLVTVACEVVSEVVPGIGRPAEVFATQLLQGRNVKPVVGRVIYEALRNGLAHSYKPYQIVVGQSAVGLVLAWKRGPHLQTVGLRHVDGHNRVVPVEKNEAPLRYVCLTAEALHKDMVTMFDTAIGDRLRTQKSFAARLSGRWPSFSRAR